MMERKRVGGVEVALTLALVAVLGGAGGMFAQDRIDAREAAAQAIKATADRQRERDIWTAKETRLNEIIDTERKRHGDAIRGRDVHLAAFSARSVRVRNELEAMLTDSRRSNDACTGRIADVAADYGQLSDLLDQGAELLEAGQGEIRRLEADNRRLAGQVAGLIEQYRAEHPEQITVTGAKK